MGCVTGPGDAAQGARGGCGAESAPALHLRPVDGKSSPAGGRGAAVRTRPAGLRGVSQHMICAAGPKAEVSQSHPGSGTDFTVGRSSSSRTELPEGSADLPLGADGQTAPLSGRGHRSHHNERLPRAPPGSSPSQNSSCGPGAEVERLRRLCQSHGGGRGAGSPRCSLSGSRGWLVSPSAGWVGSATG